MIEIHRLGARIGAEIRGVDVKALDDAGFAAIYRAWLDCNVVVVPGQDLQIEDFLRYSRRFGVVHPHPSKMTRHPDHPEITLLGVDKFRPDGALDMAVYRRGAEGWHTDGAYDQEPFKATQLYALAVPSTGGDTLFASMYAAYDALPPRLAQRLDGRTGAFTYGGRRKATALLNAEDRDWTPVFHPIIRTHPETGRKALYFDPGKILRIEGLDESESDALIEELTACMIQPDAQYRHRWRKGDIVIWDNRCSYHKAAGDYPPEEDRIHWRVSIKERAARPPRGDPGAMLIVDRLQASTSGAAAISGHSRSRRAHRQVARFTKRRPPGTLRGPMDERRDASGCATWTGRQSSPDRTSLESGRIPTGRAARGGAHRGDCADPAWRSSAHSPSARIDQQDPARRSERASHCRRLRRVIRRRGDHGKLDGEDGSPARRAVQAEGTAVRFDDAPAKGKSETRPLAHRFGREERLEDPPQDLGWNPRPRVAHRQRDAGVGGREPGADHESSGGRARMHRVMGIGDEVHHHLVELVRIRPEHRKIIGQLETDLDVVDPQRVGEQLGGFADDLIEADSLPL